MTAEERRRKLDELELTWWIQERRAELRRRRAARQPKLGQASGGTQAGTVDPRPLELWPGRHPRLPSLSR